jgi:hypothetical protein
MDVPLDGKPIISFRNAVLLAIGLVLGHLAVKLLLDRAALSRAVLDAILWAITGGPAAGGLLYAARRAERQPLQIAWMLLAASELLYALSSTLQLLPMIDTLELSFLPFSQHWVYLGGYPPFLAGILWRPIACLAPGGRRKLLLDTAIITTVAVLVAWALQERFIASHAASVAEWRGR